ncbi:MAG: TolC family protein [Burkholderiales bacterium]
MKNIDRGMQRLTVGLAALVMSAGCATVQRDAQFPALKASVAERIGKEVQWRDDTFPRGQSGEAVRKLLKNPLSADAVVQIALLNNRRLQAKFEDLGIAQSDLIEAGLLDNPVLGVSAFFQDGGTELELDVVQNFLGVFTLSARKKIGAAAAHRTTLEVSQSVLDLAAEVQNQYFRVLGDTQALGLAQQVIVATEAAAELAQRQYAAGNLSKREQSLQQAFYAQTLLELAQAEAQLEIDREKLTRLMGLWGVDVRWSLPERLPPIPAALPELNDVERRAIGRRLDLAAAKQETEGLARTLHLARQLRWLGPLGIGVQYKRSTNGEKSYGPKIEFGLPLFNQGQTRIARFESESRRAEERVAALAVDIRSEAREARSRLQALHRAAIYYETTLLPLQQTIVGETLKFYNGMLLGVYDLLLASQAQMQTGRQYIAASRDFWIAWTNLERALGDRITVPAATPAANPQSDGDNKS